MSAADSRSRSRWVAVGLRRVLVLVGLLALPLVSSWGFNVAVNAPKSIPWGPENLYGKIIGYASWGAGSTLTAVAIWLVAREGLWHSWHGWLRAAIYLSAAAYGWMLGSSFSDWFHSVRDGNRIRHRGAETVVASPPHIPFVWPGLVPQDWVRPAINLAELLVLILLSLLLFALLRGKLAEGRPTTVRKGHFGLSWLFAVTTVVAGLLAWVPILTRLPKPMHHYWTGQPVTVAMEDLLGENLPIGIVTVAAALMVIVGWVRPSGTICFWPRQARAFSRSQATPS